jgi:hypothetical protein
MHKMVKGLAVWWKWLNARGTEYGSAGEKLAKRLIAYWSGEVIGLLFIVLVLEGGDFTYLQKPHVLIFFLITFLLCVWWYIEERHDDKKG